MVSFVSPFTIMGSQILLRDYQRLFVDHASTFLRTAKPGEKRLYAAPTGSGKSLCELELLREFPDALLITPRLEIVAGMLDKLGLDAAAMSERTLIATGAAHRIVTPVRLRNLLARCNMPQPRQLVIDEGHHHSATTYQEIDCLTGNAPAVGLTATPYRGTPAQTVKFREVWGEPTWLLTYREAAERGVIAIPSCRVVPLVDDDVITVKNGEFSVEAASGEVMSRLAHVADMCRAFLDRPTMIAVPSVETARQMGEALTAAGVANHVVTGATSRGDREAAFRDCVASMAVLTQVNVVSEGVDLPIRRLVDLRPTLSPVYWLQLVGRITRPTDAPPEYLCCCRNLERHGYLFGGTLPPAVFRDAQQAFDGPSKRSGARAVGMEAVGRFKATELPMADGTTGFMYGLQSMEGTDVRQYAMIVHPCEPDPVCATRVNRRDGDGTAYAYAYARWTACEMPCDVTGFASVASGSLSDKQIAWWRTAAGRYGLDPTADVNRRSFQALPVLADLAREKQCRK